MATTAMVQGSAPGRPYKSRKDRPCDGCRKRKVVCDMPSGPPCSRCQKLSQSCQFIEMPTKRKRRSQVDNHSPSLTELIERFPDPEHYYGAAHEPAWSSLWPAASDSYRIETSDEAGHALLFDSVANPAHSPSYSRQTPPSDRMSLGQPNSAEVNTLESLPGAFSFYIGPTGTSDVSLLLRQAYDVRSHAKHVATGLSFRKVAGDFQHNSTVFGVTEHRLIENAEPRASREQIEQAWTELWDIVDRKTALQLCRLYFSFVNPYFPVMSPGACPDRVQSLGHVGLALLTGMCATALPFMLHDETLYDVLPRPPSGQRLYRLCWFGICQELHAPTLATVQACLLLQHHLPNNPVLSDTAFKWSLTSTALSAAQTIGLHRNPLPWTLVPLEERMLRQRLWWAVWTMEKWVALSRGMPTLVGDEDVDVPPLDEALTDPAWFSQDHTRNHFERLTHLTLILDDIRRSYYTVRAESMTATDLERSLDAAKPLRARLRAWQETLPINLRSWMKAQATACGNDLGHQGNDMRRLDGNASLHLSYIVTHMMLFRALLRPIERTKCTSGYNALSVPEHFEGVSAIIKGALFCARELVDFLESLPDSTWNAFWHCWSRPNFAMAGSFMVHLLYTISPVHGLRTFTSDDTSENFDIRPTSEHGNQPNDPHSPFIAELNELQHLIKRWRWVNRVSANGAAGVKGLTNLGLFKVETMLAELGRL